MKIILSFIFILSLNSAKVLETEVYICDSTSAVAYHKTDKCTGIQNCTHTIKSVSLSDAKDKYKRRACKKCY